MIKNNIKQLNKIMKESQIPEISQSGNYEAKNCVLEEV